MLIELKEKSLMNYQEFVLDFKHFAIMLFLEKLGNSNSAKIKMILNSLY